MAEKVEETGTPREEVPVAEPEIDFERIKDGDAEYTREVNERLAKEASGETAPAPNEVEKKEVPPTDGAAPAEEFLTFEDGDPVYRGQPFKVKKTEAKALIQKGRHLETRLGELSPFVNIVKGNPNLEKVILQAAKDPDKAALLNRVAEQIAKGEFTQGTEEDLSDLDLEGLHPDDVKNVAKIQAALRKREEKRRAKDRGDLDEVQLEAKKRKDREASLMVETLRVAEGEIFDKVQPVMRKMMQEAKDAVEMGEMPQEFYDNLVRSITDPDARDESGRPIFFMFYNEAKKRLAAAEGASVTAETVPQGAPPPATPKNNSARIAPGTTAPAGGSSKVDWENMDKSEFDQKMSEALSRV